MVVVQLVLRRRVHARSLKQITDFPVPQITEDIVVVGQLVLRGRVHARVVKQITDFTVPQITEDIVVVGQLVLCNWNTLCSHSRAEGSMGRGLKGMR